MRKVQILSVAVLLAAPLAIGQSRGPASGPAGRGQGSAWCDRNGDGACDYSGRQVGQGRGMGSGGSGNPGVCGRGNGARAGRAMTGRGMPGRGMGRGFVQAVPSQPPAQTN